MIGSQLGHYAVLAKLGEGGMGTVYRARDTRLGRDVAMKILPPAAAGDKELCARFEREARAIAALQHPNIVTIYSVEEEGGFRFITMELVEGQALSELIPAAGMPHEEFYEIALPLVDAVSCAHTQGIAHRDLKPTNIMLQADRRPKVLDFGLAKLGGAEAPLAEETLRMDSTITEAGRIMGTVPYMSPEQIKGGEVGPSSDLFSLGIVFHEILSGVRPFRGEYAAEVMHKIASEPIPRLREIPEALADIVERCLCKDPGDRFANAGALLTALREAAGADTIDGAPTSLALAAYERRDWPEAERELRSIMDQRELTPNEVEALGHCVGWQGRFVENIELWEQASAAYTKAGDQAGAARLALSLTGLYLEKNAETVANGWLKRAERLLRDQPESIEHGRLLRRQTIAALRRQDFMEALELNRRCLELAERFQDANLVAETRHDHGQILVARGDVNEGIEHIDEAMVAAMGGDLDPTTLGNLYCRTMVVCRSLADFKRSQEWSEIAWRWCEATDAPGSGYPGLCRIYSAETMRHVGKWGEAETAVRDACETFEHSGLEGHAGNAYYELGELALRKGDYPAAEEAFRRAHSFGCDPVPGLPLLQLAQGKPEAALRMIERALGEMRDDRLGRARLLVAIVPIALANGARTTANAAAAELDEIARDFDSLCFTAHALMGQGALAIELGDCESAAASLRKALSSFMKLGFIYDAAQARILLAKAYRASGNEEDARMQLLAAHKTFSELNAGPDCERVTDMIAEMGG